MFQEGKWYRFKYEDSEESKTEKRHGWTTAMNPALKKNPMRCLAGGLGGKGKIIKFQGIDGPYCWAYEDFEEVMEFSQGHKFKVTTEDGSSEEYIYLCKLENGGHLVTPILWEEEYDSSKMNFNTRRLTDEQIFVDTKLMELKQNLEKAKEAIDSYLND